MDLLGQTFFKSVLYLPTILSQIVSGLIWQWFYEPEEGVVNILLRGIGFRHITIAWIGDFHTAFFAVFLVSLWLGTGMTMMLYFAGLRSLPKDCIDASKIDGANFWQQLRLITIPLLRNTHIVVIALLTTNSLQTFDLIYSMTYGGPGETTMTIALKMYFEAFMGFRWGIASSYSVFISVIAFIIIVPYLRVMYKREVEF